MANFTEKAIEETFVQLLNEKPLDKITVREISEACGINRNTFYYHYHDIFDLLESLLKEEEDRLLSGIENASTLRQALAESLRFIFENERAVYHIYKSVSRDLISEHIFNVASICMRHYLELLREGLDVPDDDFDQLVFLYASMIEGAALNVLREGVQHYSEPFIDDSVRLLEGSCRLALENSARTLGQSCANA